jgi:septum formation protein
MELPFEVRTIEVAETYPPHLSPTEVAMHLALKKASAVAFRAEKELIIAADTLVVSPKGLILGKPATEYDAMAMLHLLSGQTHEVITGVAMRLKNKEKVFAERTKVRFSEMNEDEIQYYVKQHQPMDKAGAYGIQEWIGHIAIESIEGCYYNVVGFPCARFYRELKDWEK